MNKKSWFSNWPRGRAINCIRMTAIGPLKIRHHLGKSSHEIWNANGGPFGISILCQRRSGAYNATIHHGYLSGTMYVGQYAQYKWKWAGFIQRFAKKISLPLCRYGLSIWPIFAVLPSSIRSCTVRRIPVLVHYRNALVF